MGQNLSRNIARNGYPIVVYDREPHVVDKFVSEVPEESISGARSPEEFISRLERPRKIILLVKAGDPVDWTIGLIKSKLEPGDAIIDAGNSHFKDTERRQRELAEQEIHLIGSGISGGETGALLGPSLMPGGDRDAYEQIRRIWEAIAAKVDDGPCVTYVGTGGAGHFVKMVHNGIEYADMQLIAESYDLLRKVLGLAAEEMAKIFAEWNRGELESYLIEITATILGFKDKETGQPLVDLVLDKAGQKGTGRWTSQVALDLGIPIPTIDAAITARTISASKAERIVASRELAGPKPSTFTGDKREFIDEIRKALYAAKLITFAQGMNLIRAGSEEWNWNINLSEIARIWKGGCIIRARLLDKIKNAYLQDPELPSLLFYPEFQNVLAQAQTSWRNVIKTAIDQGLPVLAMTASLGHYEMFRTPDLPLNLTQAQRDLFGSHTYERIDRPELGFVHTDWEEE